MWPLDAGLEIGECTFYPGCDIDVVELRKSALSGCRNRGMETSLRDHIHYLWTQTISPNVRSRQREALITQNKGNQNFFCHVLTVGSQKNRYLNTKKTESNGKSFYSWNKNRKTIFILISTMCKIKSTA